MKRFWPLVTVCLCVALAGSAAFGYARRHFAKPSSRVQSETFYPTEQLWIVNDITGAISNIAAYANGASTSAVQLAVHQVSRTGNEMARFDVTPIARPSIAIRITDHIWAPSAYAPVAAAVMGTRAAACEPSTSSIASALLQPTRETIQRENLRVSARLKANVRCADAHVEAALILGTLALREAASVFNDPRRLMSRMTAHLALADALGVSASDETRRLAEVVLYTLVGRQRTALDRLAAFDSTTSSATLQSWARALRMRNTGDWRIVPDSNQVTLLEQIELIRAAQYSLGETRTLEFIDGIRNRPVIPDWARIVMQDARGVQAGNRFAADAVALELTEAGEARKSYSGDALDSAEALVAALKVEPSQGPVAPDGAVWVVDWSMWAAIAERHLMSTINARDTHLTYALSVPDEAKEFREQVARTFSGLRLYPFLAIHLATTREEAKPGMAGSLVLLQTHPELVTHWMWKTVLMKETWASLPKPLPRLESWFTPAFPSGTVFDANTRPWDAHLVSQVSPAEIAPYRKEAPYSRSLPFVTLGPKYEDASAPTLKKELGEVAAFNLSFATRIANALKDDPDAYLAAMEPVVRMSPEQLLDVAEYHVQDDRLDAARSTYERWFATSRQEVAVANNAEWMVRDYFVRGESAKADALANRAASTYSPSGLLTRAHLYEWSNRPRAAEECYRRESERYDDPAPLLGFLLRHHRQGVEVDALKWKVFPGGVVSVSLPALRDAPVAGVEVAGVEKIGTRHGVHLNDIIVAVDGVRVNNRAQYYAAKAMSIDPDMRLTVWRDLKYVEVTGPLRFGGLWGAVRDYDPRSQKKAAASTPPRRW
jgi:hypothetical protein